MLNNKIHSQIIKKRSFLCVGLDIDIHKIPKSLLKLDDPIFELFHLSVATNSQLWILTHQISSEFSKIRLEFRNGGFGLPKKPDNGEKTKMRLEKNIRNSEFNCSNSQLKTLEETRTSPLAQHF